MTSTGSGAVWRRTMAGDCGRKRPAVDVTVAAAMVPTEQRGRVGEGCNGRVGRGERSRRRVLHAIGSRGGASGGGGGGRPRRRGCRAGGGGDWAPAEPQGGAERPDGARRDPA